MKLAKILAGVALLCTLLPSVSQAKSPQAPTRPAITGIDHIAFYTTDVAGVDHLYKQLMGLTPAPLIERGQVRRFWVGHQWVGYRKATNPHPESMLDHVAFTTANASQLRRYLKSKGVRVPARLTVHSDGSRSFLVRDPEGNKVEFVQRPKHQKVPAPTPQATSRQIIHVGYKVHSRAAEDKFYKDILGFRLYWFGGMKAGNLDPDASKVQGTNYPPLKPSQIDWVSMQVPNGHQWLEYMLNQPAHVSLRQSGVLDHFSLGVRDMTRTQDKLEANGWKPSKAEHRQKGLDGKWQLNLFDPNYSRIEYMEFKPFRKPCCSPFRQAHPSPAAD